MVQVLFPPPVDASGRKQLAPTDISQFVRLDQCRRYLRLRMHHRAFGGGFMHDAGVVPQSIPALLTRAGACFEQTIEAAVRSHYLTHHFERDAQDHDATDNQAVAWFARDLPRGQVHVLFQARIEAMLGDWRLRGDVDMIRLERDASGDLRVLIVDMKASTSTKVEHRLQVEFYHRMLAALFAEHSISCDAIETAILFRGPREIDNGASDDERRRHDEQRELADRLFGTRDGLLEVVADQDDYLGAVEELVTGEHATAREVAEAPFDTLPFHLGYKCDGCLYNEFCMKWCFERDDLSLVPHLTMTEKRALQAAGVTTTRELATLRRPAPDNPRALVPAPGREALNATLATTWPVGPRLDELVQRARRYRKQVGDDIAALTYIPNGGHCSLPYCAPNHDPNLVRVYIDVQHDYLNDRLYLAGSSVVACDGGVERPDGRRSVVLLADEPPTSPSIERDLLVRWISDTLAAIRDVAAPVIDDQGRPTAPIHLILFNQFARQVLLDALSRHFPSIVEATPLYDFVTQLAAYDSPIVSYLEDEVREQKNYPLVCQSLQAIASFIGFDWRDPLTGEDYRELFRTRLFDQWDGIDQPDGSVAWYTGRARFNSQVPLEYAYAAWGQLQVDQARSRDDLSRYLSATPERLRGFQTRRLAAIEYIASTFKGNDKTYMRPFDLSSLAEFSGRARTLAEALDEFLTIERHVALAAWRATRLLPAERRVLTGETLIARYVEADQDPAIAELNRQNLRKHELLQAYKSTLAEHGDDATLTKEQRDETRWNHTGVEFRLRIETQGAGCGLDEALALSNLNVGDWVVINERLTFDSRPGRDRSILFPPTPKQMLYGMRAEIVGIEAQRTPNGTVGFVRVKMTGPMGGRDSRGYLFAGYDDPFRPDELYTLDPNPNDIYGFWCMKVVDGLCRGEPDALYDRLGSLADARVRWDERESAAQARFMTGLRALHNVGAFDGFEEAKQRYIGACGDSPVLLVQGPPGTGKSYTTAFAVFARLQGALAAEREFRVVVSCKTHAATNVLLKNLAEAHEKLAEFRVKQPAIFAEHFDARLLETPLCRIDPREDPPSGVTALYKPDDPRRPPSQGKVFVELASRARWIAGATPGGIYRMLTDRFSKNIFGHDLCDLLVLDETSQMNLPEALMAALPLKAEAQVIVVGDHRQMPPIVQHDWANERRRTFREYRTYESLFDTLRALGPPTIKFAESFRLHADMAEFLRREVYRHDGINFHSKAHDSALTQPNGDPLPVDPESFAGRVLDPNHPLVVVVHDEDGSQQRNPFEQYLMGPVLEALATLGASAEDTVARHVGVVVPHRAQRAMLQERVRCLTVRDPDTDLVLRSAVDTVERFQGDERVAIVVSATESDPQYLLVSSDFLLDPRRLTVALSRAKRKMILVAARSVFNVFSADEETFVNAQIWKNLLRHTCTVPLWSGYVEWDGGSRHVEVFGNVPSGHDGGDGGPHPQPLP